MATSFNTFPPVLAAWNAAGGAARLGGPTSDLRDEAGGKSCDFADGASIWWSAATGAHVVHGAIKARWLQLGGPSSPLGYPSTDETAAPGGGFYNDFQNAMSIYWTQATGARVIQGLIRAKWLQSGGAGGPLGYPAADETACPGGGRVSLFSGGTSIYWSAATGAHPVRGPVRDKWLAAGGPATLGLPTGDEVLLEGGGLEQSFQAARITWTASAGASVGPLPNVAAELSTVLGQALSDALSAAYGQGAGGPVFLPYGINVPNDLVQSGAVNTVQLQTWLTSQFDAPFAISPATASVLAKDLSHGSASQIYGTAVGFAQPLDSAGGTHDRLAAEIVGVRASYGPDGQTGCIACEPDDWPLATLAQPYWTSFDFSPGSVATQPASAQPAATAAVQPSAWRLRVLPGLRPQPAPSPAAAAPAQTSTAPGPVTLDAAHLLATTRAITMAPSAFAASGAPIDPATAITVHLEHTCVTLSYTDAGQPWWNNVFLDDPAWFIPGMSRGALLPPAQGALSAVYALPTALVIVRNLRVCGALTDDAKRALASRAASLGPLSMTDASTEIESDGTTAFRRDGLQVVALFCSALPVLPPNNAPATADAVH